MAGDLTFEPISRLLDGTVDLCLLAVVAAEPSCASQMVEELAGWGLDLTAGGSIYPALSRLRRRGLVESFLVGSPEGPPRTHYRITPQGRESLDRGTQEWRRLSGTVNRILEGAPRG